MTDTELVRTYDVKEEATAAVAALENLLDSVIANNNDLVRRLADAQTYLNTVCHQRDDEAEENRCLGLEIERLTREIEELRAAAA